MILAKDKFLLSAALLISLGIFSMNAMAEENKWTRLVEESGKVLSEVQEMPDQGIPKDLLENVKVLQYSRLPYLPDLSSVASTGRE